MSNEPTLISEAPSRAIRVARQSTVDAMASTLNVSFDHACDLYAQALAHIEKIPVAERRYMASLVAHRETVHVLRGLSMAAAGLFHTRTQETERGAGELAAVTRVKAGSDLHRAIRYLLANPPDPEDTPDA